jgi:hypothetical protein
MSLSISKFWYFNSSLFIKLIIYEKERTKKMIFNPSEITKLVQIALVA